MTTTGRAVSSFPHRPAVDPGDLSGIPSFGSAAWWGLVRRIAAAMPADLRGMRARMMLRPYWQSAAMPERTCPACGGLGRRRRDCIEWCPVCIGMQKVPERVWRYTLNSLAAGRPTGTGHRLLRPYDSPTLHAHLADRSAS